MGKFMKRAVTFYAPVSGTIKEVKGVEYNGEKYDGFQIATDDEVIYMPVTHGKSSWFSEDATMMTLNSKHPPFLMVKIEGNDELGYATDLGVHKLMYARPMVKNFGKKNIKISLLLSKGITDRFEIKSHINANNKVKVNTPLYDLKEK